jgi:hypothetical protein
MREELVGYENFNEEVYERYNVNKKEIPEIYNNYKLYNKMLQYDRKHKEDKDEAKRKYKITYYCELCDKDVRIAVKYQHVRTMKHLKFKNEVEKAMQSIE